MEFSQLQRVNKELKTLDVKGKDYVEVNERVKAFRMLYPEGTIVTEIKQIENGSVIIQATIYADYENDKLLATGIAQEKEGSTYINKTSYIENCETSAVGRALGFLGIGIDTSIASAEEVQNAIVNQNKINEDDLITTAQEKALRDICKKCDTDYVMATLKDYGYTRLSEIKQKEYMTIVKQMEGGYRN